MTPEPCYSVSLEDQIARLESELKSLKEQLRLNERRERLRAKALKKLTDDEKDALGV